MMPSLFASANVNGRAKKPLTGSADRVARRAGADRRHRLAARIDAERQNLVAVVRCRDGDVPAERPAVDDRRVDRELEPEFEIDARFFSTDVAAGARRRGDRQADQRVVRLLVVVREVDVHAVGEHAALEAGSRTRADRSGLSTGLPSAVWMSPGVSTPGGARR